MEFWCGTCRYDTQVQCSGVHCQGSPFWCQNAQSETNWRGRHAKEAENLAFSGGKRRWNGLKLSQNNPSPLAHHFHRVSLTGSSGAMRYHAKPYRLGQRLLGSVRGWKKRDRVTIRLVNKTHRRQSTILGLIISSPIRTAFSRYCWRWSALPSPPWWDSGRSDRPQE